MKTYRYGLWFFVGSSFSGSFLTYTGLRTFNCILYLYALSKGKHTHVLTHIVFIFIHASMHVVIRLLQLQQYMQSTNYNSCLLLLVAACGQLPSYICTLYCINMRSLCYVVFLCDLNFIPVTPSISSWKQKQKRCFIMFEAFLCNAR